MNVVIVVKQKVDECDMKPIIYLSGPIAKCSDSEARDWREYVKSRKLILSRNPNWEDFFDTIDPMVRDFRGHEMTAELSKMIVELDYFDIRSRANCLLANLNFDKAMVGTIMEIKDAYDHSKLTVINMPAGSSISPWLRYHSHKITHSLDDALEYILEAFR
jgi:hypothetical protein